MKYVLALLLGLIIVPGSAHAQDDLIHSDLPLWGYDAEGVWPKGYHDASTVGCIHNTKLGHWAYETQDSDDSWFALRNYGVFHCYLIVEQADEREALPASEAELSYLISLGESEGNEKGSRLWALQMGGRPGSEYILLASKLNRPVLDSFDVLQRHCPEKNIRSRPDLDILKTDYCAINSQRDLIRLAKKMAQKPLLATLSFAGPAADQP